MTLAQRFSLGLSILFMPVLLGFVCQAQTGDYTFVNIDYPGWVGRSYATGINDSAQVVGNYGSNGSGSGGFFYDGANYHDVTYSQGDSTLLWGLSNDDTMSGFYIITGISYGITYHGGVFTQIDYPGALLTQPYGINNHDDVTGGYATDFESGFIYTRGIFTTLNYPGAIATQIWAINDSRQVVGSYGNSDGSGHVFYYDGSHFTTLDYPGADQTILTGINNAGLVCGYYIDDSGNEHSFLWTVAHGFVPINYANQIAVNGINNSAQIAGAYLGQDGSPHGFIGTPAGQPTYTLSISVTGPGTASSMDGHLSCPPNCSYPYPAGAPVSLTATPTQGDVFVTWSGACSGNGPCNVTMNQNQTVGAVFSGPLQFVSMTPCRVVDTRNPAGAFGGPPIQGMTSRSFPLPQGACGIPASASAYSLNVTLVPHGSLGYLTVWPTGENQPTVSTMNSIDGRTKATAAIVPAGTSGAVSVYVTNTTDVVLDIDGYFTAPGGQTLQFYPLTPCRVLDTRNPNGPLGGPYLQSGDNRSFPVLSSDCTIPASAQAYSMNFTVTPYEGQPLGYLTVWAEGGSKPVVSTLNNPTATYVANAAIVPAGTAGGITVFPSGNTQLIVDIDGYFAAPGSGGLSLYPTAPCRVLDTRQGGGAFSGEIIVDTVHSPCRPSSSAQAYTFNATVVPVESLSYLTLWPDSEQQPLASTLNAIDGAITSNMAIVPNVNGLTDGYAAGTTNLILDLNSYFAP